MGAGSRKSDLMAPRPRPHGSLAVYAEPEDGVRHHLFVAILDLVAPSWISWLEFGGKCGPGVEVGVPSKEREGRG